MVSINTLPTFAVILAAYNGVKYLGAQIESILQQNAVSVHIFISIDISTDGTADFLNKNYGFNPKITILPVLGYRFGGAGPNFYRLLSSVNVANYDYLSFSDQDDLWNPNKLYRAHCQLIDHMSDGYSSNFTAFWDNGVSKLVNKSYPQNDFDYFFESAGPGCTYVLSKNLAESFKRFIQGAHPTLVRVEFHDWLVYAFARHHNYKWFIDNWSSLYYRQHSSNQIGVNSGFGAFYLRVKKILCGYGVSQSLLIANLIGAECCSIIIKGLNRGRLGYSWLALKCLRCRRRPLDQFLFFASCLFMFFLNPNIR